MKIFSCCKCDRWSIEQENCCGEVMDSFSKDTVVNILNDYQEKMKALKGVDKVFLVRQRDYLEGDHVFSNVCYFTTEEEAKEYVKIANSKLTDYDKYYPYDYETLDKGVLECLQKI